jgi:SAM-dependent methyltransferase
MPNVTDWLALWRELSEVQETVFKAAGEKDSDDIWRKRAEHFDNEIRRRWEKPDSSRHFIISKLKANPEWTVLDIGGGTGAWACLMAQYARHVTVVEPSPAMTAIMRKNLARANSRNVDIVEAEWPNVQVDRYDMVLCSHAMYGFPDFELFVRSLEAASRHLCVLIMRAPDPKGLMSMAAKHIWGHPYDSPDYQVGFNALLQLGIFPNVLMEDTGLWDPWTSSDIEEALALARKKLHLPEKSEYDQYLRDLLERNLVLRDGILFWPKGIRSALIYWDVDQE